VTAPRAARSAFHLSPSAATESPKIGGREPALGSTTAELSMRRIEPVAVGPAPPPSPLRVRAAVRCTPGPVVANGVSRALRLAATGAALFQVGARPAIVYGRGVGGPAPCPLTHPRWAVATTMTTSAPTRSTPSTLTASASRGAGVGSSGEGATSSTRAGGCAMLPRLRSASLTRTRAAGPVRGVRPCMHAPALAIPSARGLSRSVTR
jgi:hypothetical protein